MKQREANKFKKGKKDDSDDDLFSKEGSEIIGKEKRVLMAKIVQYRNLFKKELGKFKVKKGASVEELKLYLTEMETIVSIDGCEAFCLDSLYAALQMIEGVTSHTRDFDLTGLNQILRGNIQFQSIVRQLFVKYNTFSAIPIEYQCIFTVSISAYICTQMNRKRKMAGGV